MILGAACHAVARPGDEKSMRVVGIVLPFMKLEVKGAISPSGLDSFEGTWRSPS